MPHGPFGTTVRRVRLMLADGTLVACSPTENTALFRLAMGGYGLAGIVLDVEAAMLPNRLLTPLFEVMPSTAFAEHFVTLCTDPTVTKPGQGTLDYRHSDGSRHRARRRRLMPFAGATPPPPILFGF